MTQPFRSRRVKPSPHDADAVHGIDESLGVLGQDVTSLVSDHCKPQITSSAGKPSTEGYRFDHSLVELTEDVCRKSASNLSSMLQDVRAGRRTEIDMISGEILKRAEIAFLPTPRTRVVFQLIKAIEERSNFKSAV